jgi:hypothetical protein
VSDFSLGVALPPEDGFPARSPRRRRTAHCAPQAVQRVTPNRVIPARCFGAYLSGVAASPDRVARSPLLAAPTTTTGTLRLYSGASRT